MNLSVSGIIACTTMFLGEFTKQFGLVNKKYIPLQSLIIGIVSGLLCYLTELETDLLTSIIYCTISAMSGSGIYDVATIKKPVIENEGEIE